MNVSVFVLSTSTEFFNYMFLLCGKLSEWCCALYCRVARKNKDVMVTRGVATRYDSLHVLYWQRSAIMLALGRSTAASRTTENVQYTMHITVPMPNTWHRTFSLKHLFRLEQIQGSLLLSWPRTKRFFICSAYG